MAKALSTLCMSSATKRRRVTTANAGASEKRHRRHQRLYIGVAVRRRAGEFLRPCGGGRVPAGYSEPILQETLRVLREKFHWNEEALGEAEEDIRSYTAPCHAHRNA